MDGVCAIHVRYSDWIFSRDEAEKWQTGVATVADNTSSAQNPLENAKCPYSGEPVSEFMELDGRVFGFCNGFCRDKTVADAAVWPGFMGVYGAS